MLRKLSLVSLRSAILAASTLVASESLVGFSTFAQNEPPAGGNNGGGQRGGGGWRGGGQGGGQRGGGMGGMGRGMQDMREALEADFQRRDVPIFVRQLKLTEDQGTVLETLFVDYEAQYQPESEAIMASMSEIGQTMMRSVMSPERQQQMRDTWQTMQQEQQDFEAKNGPMDDDARRAFFRERMQAATEKFSTEAATSGMDAEVKAALGQMLEKLEAWQTRKAQIRDNFTAGMKVVLDDDQLALWPAFDRFLVREKTLPRGRISGENVNLFFVVDEIRLPQEEFAKIEPMFNDYETRLDSALRARNSYIEESMPQLFKSVQTGDISGATRIFKKQSELRASVRDVNEEFRTSMVGALGETEWSKSLDKAVLEKGWDRIFRPTGTDRIFEAAMKIEGLDASILTSITDLLGSYHTELAPLNSRLKELARTEEPAQIVTEGERFVTAISQGVSGFARNMGGFGGAGNNADDPSRKVQEARTTLGEQYQERLKALLTPEQWEALPKNNRGGQGGQGGRGQGGMQGILDRLPEEQRKQFMDRVDTNKNGEIDEDERNGVREYMREQFPNMGGQGGQGGGRGGPGGRGGQGGQGGQGNPNEV